MRAMSDNLLDSTAINEKIEAAKLDNVSKTLDSEKRIKKFLLIPIALMIADLVVSVLNFLK